jgi:hypothetical protein
MEVSEICKYLRSKGQSFEEVFETEGGLCVSVSWGDWKHDHLYLNHIMEEIGYSCDDEIVTEENGDDCYSSEHYFSTIK